MLRAVRSDNDMTDKWNLGPVSPDRPAQPELTARGMMVLFGLGVLAGWILKGLMQ